MWRASGACPIQSAFVKKVGKSVKKKLLGYIKCRCRTQVASFQSGNEIVEKVGKLVEKLLGYNIKYGGIYSNQLIKQPFGVI